MAWGGLGCFHGPRPDRLDWGVYKFTRALEKGKEILCALKVKASLK